MPDRRMRRLPPRFLVDLATSTEGTGSIHQEEDLPPVQVSPKKSKMLGELLYNSLFKEPNAADLTVIIGPERSKVKGHKAVFAATSEVFATKLHSQNWNNTEEGEQGELIEFPQDISENSAKLFVKYIYLEELNIDSIKEREGWERALVELIYLGDLFMVKELKNLAEEILVSEMDPTNCVAIYQEARRFGSITDNLRKESYDCLKENVGEIIDNFKGQAGSHWEPETWKTLLSEDNLDVEEIDLFLALRTWNKEERISTNKEQEEAEAVKELFRLIRYLLISVEYFAEDIAQSDVLNQSDVIKIFVHWTMINCGRKPESLPFSGYHPWGRPRR